MIGCPFNIMVCGVNWPRACEPLNVIVPSTQVPVPAHIKVEQPDVRRLLITTQAAAVAFLHLPGQPPRGVVDVLT